MRILIVEDQEKLASLLQKSFENEGFTADYVTDGETALRRIELHHNDYDAIILDLMLPKKTETRYAGKYGAKILLRLC